MGNALLKPALAAAVTAVVAVTAAVATGSGSPDADIAVAAAPAPPASAVFHPVVREPAARTGAYAAEYTVYRPADLDRTRDRLPVVVFGNGACRHTSNDELLTVETLLAAHGFVVVAVGGFDQPALTENGTAEPKVITDAITWAGREDGRPGSALRNRLDTRRTGVAGHSCGGIEALVAGADPRVKSVLSLDSGFFADGTLGYGRENLGNLHTPTLFVDGGPDDVAYANSGANYDLVTVPAVRATNPAAGHTGFVYGQRGALPDPSVREEAVRVLVAWFDFTLNGNRTARGYFLGAGCGLCATPGWTVGSKNF
ncbi:poly(ethylene terephthalate) hydrolase family protein [Amycolatopsis sp. NBC_00438]|uniref:poly(ethylene terephthalate) hydrolase family protein n=1 Tax=Amycolatopsis sp. NBC_00438 TaxID=2903558 RepID=UPI002E20C254